MLLRQQSAAAPSCHKGLRRDGGGESALETNWEGPAVREPAAVEVVELQQENSRSMPQNGATPQLEKSEQTLGSGGKLTTVLMEVLEEKTQEDEDVLYQSDNGRLVEKPVAHLEEIVEVADWGEEDDLLEAELAADHNISKRNPPPQATTFSKRVPRSGISVLKLVEDRVAAKNLEAPGTSKTNPFIIPQ